MADVTDVGQAVCVPYDPTIYMGTARYYARGRPPYSRELVSTLTAELSWRHDDRPRQFTRTTERVGDHA